MKRGILALVFLCSLITAQAQSLFLMSADTSYMQSKGFVNLDFGGEYRSSALNNRFMEKLIFGGKIDGDDKEVVNRKLKDINRLGGVADINLSYYSFIDTLLGSDKWGMKINIEDCYDLSYNFPEDFYRLLFEGNKQFAGKSVDFSEMSTDLVVFQKFGVGFFNKRNFSGATLSYVNGQDYHSLAVHDAQLFTSEIGDSLHLRYNADYTRSDSSYTGLGTGNGSGAALDFILNLPLAKNGGFISLEMENLGFIKWNDKTLHYHADSSVAYTGVDISDIFNNDLGQMEVPNIEDTLIYQIQTGSELVWLPTNFKLSLLKRIDATQYFNVGIAVKPVRANVPELYGGYNYFIDENTLITASFAYGGYGNFRVGAALQKRWKNWFVRLETEDIPGLILDDMRGRGAWFSLGKIFGKQ